MFGLLEDKHIARKVTGDAVIAPMFALEILLKQARQTFWCSEIERVTYIITSSNSVRIIFENGLLIC